MDFGAGILMQHAGMLQNERNTKRKLFEHVMDRMQQQKQFDEKMEYERGKPKPKGALKDRLLDSVMRIQRNQATPDDMALIEGVVALEGGTKTVSSVGPGGYIRQETVPHPLMKLIRDNIPSEEVTQGINPSLPNPAKGPDTFQTLSNIAGSALPADNSQPRNFDEMVLGGSEPQYDAPLTVGDIAFRSGDGPVPTLPPMSNYMAQSPNALDENLEANIDLQKEGSMNPILNQRDKNKRQNELDFNAANVANKLAEEEGKAEIGDDSYAARKEIDRQFKNIELSEAAKKKQKSLESKMMAYLKDIESLIDTGVYKQELPDDASLGDVIKNVIASSRTSEGGRAIEGVLGTQVSSRLEKLDQAHPLIFGEFRELLGMTGRELDTKAEQDYYKGLIPRADKEINTILDALSEFSGTFGNGDVQKEVENVREKLRSSDELSPQEKQELESLRAKYGRRM